MGSLRYMLREKFLACVLLSDNFGPLQYFLCFFLQVPHCPRELSQARGFPDLPVQVRGAERRPTPEQPDFISEQSGPL